MVGVKILRVDASRPIADLTAELSRPTTGSIQRLQFAGFGDGSDGSQM
jgi:hypothetical protein